MSPREVRLLVVAVVFIIVWLLLEIASAPAAIRDSMVRVVSDPGNGRAGHGSGTILIHGGKTTAIITAWHVVDDGGVIYIHLPDGEIVNAERINTSLEIDACLLETKRLSHPATGWASAVSGDVTAAGFGPGIYRERTGRVKNTRHVGYDVYTSKVREGDSGGGVFDGDGKLVGVISAREAERDRWGRIIRLGQESPVYASKPGLLDKFIRGALPPASTLTQCADGWCYQSPQRQYYQVQPQPYLEVPGVNAPQEQGLSQAAPAPDFGEMLDPIKERLDKVEQNVNQTVSLLEKLQQAQQGLQSIPDQVQNLEVNVANANQAIASVDEQRKRDKEEAGQLDYDEVTKQVLKRLPPMRFKRLHPYTGKVVADELARLGDCVILSDPVKVKEE